MRRSSILRAAAIAVLAASPAPLSAQARTDSLAVVRAVSAFHDALARGDSTAALRLLAGGVVVQEAGEVERLADYRRHHLPADIAFARSVHGERTLVSVEIRGDAAWVASTTLSRGEFNGRPVDAQGAELMVLARAGAGRPWAICAIHWSSRRRAAPPPG